MTEPAPITDESWWSRPSGVREVLRIAMPMVASTLSWTLMSFIDSAILYKVSPAAMSAAFSASVTWFAMLSLMWGICTYTGTFVSQYHGDGQPEKIGPVVWQGVWLAALFAPLALAAIPLAPWLFALHDATNATAAALETQFFKVLCWGAPGMLAAQAMEAFFSGRQKTWVVMCVDAVAVLVNLVLACVWVLGWGGGQSWGIEGAAWATVVAQWSRAAMFAALMTLPRAHRRQYNTLSGRPVAAMLRRLMRFGGPSGVQMLLDVGGFAFFVQMVGTIGDVAMDATGLVFRVSHVAFMPVWGLGLATVVLVGQRLGEDRPHLARRAARTTLGLGLGYMAVISLLFVAAPAIFLQLYNLDPNATALSAQEHAAVQALSVELMRFVAAYNMFDATLIIFTSVLRGAGDTKFIMRVSMVGAVVLVAATWLAVKALGVGVYGCWTIVTVWIWLLAATYVLRYRQGRWQSMRVIDQQHHGAGKAALEIDGQRSVERIGAGEMATAAD
jgi:MATE family multidrug resistance protein